jgi:hypothetical protein
MVPPFVTTKEDEGQDSSENGARRKPRGGKEQSWPTKSGAGTERGALLYDRLVRSGGPSSVHAQLFGSGEGSSFSSVPKNIETLTQLGQGVRSGIRTPSRCCSVSRSSTIKRHGPGS